MKKQSTTKTCLHWFRMLPDCEARDFLIARRLAHPKCHHLKKFESLKDAIKGSIKIHMTGYHPDMWEGLIDGLGGGGDVAKSLESNYAAGQRLAVTKNYGR